MNNETDTLDTTPAPAPDPAPVDQLVAQLERLYDDLARGRVTPRQAVALAAVQAYDAGWAAAKLAVADAMAALAAAYAADDVGDVGDGSVPLHNRPGHSPVRADFVVNRDLDG
jgi:hypothetical protein